MTGVVNPIFGKMITGPDVERAAIDTITLWEETYLAEMERQQGLSPHDLPLFRSKTTSNAFQKWTEDQLPGLVAVSPGLQSKPKVEGDGKYRAPFILGFAVVCSADTRENTHMLAGLYAAVLRAIILQVPDLGGISRGVVWEHEAYDDISADKNRSLASAQVMFTVEIADVIHSKAGMRDPMEDPYADPTTPVAETVEVTTEKVG